MADKNKIAPLDTITMQELFENVYCTNAAVIKDLTTTQDINTINTEYVNSTAGERRTNAVR